jgi:hypothetical protein
MQSNGPSSVSLSIEGDEVRFSIKVAGGSGARAEGAPLPSVKPYLLLEVFRNGRRAWWRSLPEHVYHGIPMLNQFSGDSLETLYRRTITI